MAKKKGARPARKTGASAKKAGRKAAAPARRTAKAAKKTRKTPAATSRSRRTTKKSAKPARAARPASRKAAARPAARTRKAAAGKPVLKVRKAAATKPAPRKAAPRKAAAKAKAPAAAKSRRPAARPSATPTPVKAATPIAAKPQAKPVKAAAKKANLDRPRRTVAEIHGVPSSLDMDRTASAVRTGRAELEQKLQQQTDTSPALTAGDVDADWGAAASSGDEAPGGDNPTPDQDVVDEIGRALGVEYEDDEELQGGDEIAARDRHRWELDPESSDDFEDR